MSEEEKGSWFWSKYNTTYSHGDGHWDGPHPTMEAACEAAFKELFYVRSGRTEATVLVATGTLCDPAAYVPDANAILDDMAGAASNDGPEDWPDDVSTQAKSELNTFLAAWARKHCPTTWHLIDGEPVRFHMTADGRRWRLVTDAKPSDDVVIPCLP